jgi:hypothetical protein
VVEIESKNIFYPFYVSLSIPKDYTLNLKKSSRHADKQKDLSDKVLAIPL